MFQRWEDLLFAHWPLPASVLRPLVPEPLVLEEFGGSAWLGLTPFMLSRLHARALPPLPGVARFPEMNLRTYVRVGDRPGIFFFTLEAANRLAVLGARASYRLPYHHARMSVERLDDWTRYRSVRDDGAAEFSGRYRATGPTFVAEPGTLEYFLVERYALYVVLRNGSVLRGDIHHRPWRIRSARAEIERNTVPAAHGITLPDRDPVLHHSERQDTLLWLPRLVR
ncbi:MAG: YqjF family protein [Longimicrobiales bacterium]